MYRMWRERREGGIGWGDGRVRGRERWREEDRRMWWVRDRIVRREVCIVGCVERRMMVARWWEARAGEGHRLKWWDGWRSHGQDDRACCVR